MIPPPETLIGLGTALWLDSVDSELVVANCQLGATGAMSNPLPSLMTGSDYVSRSLCALSLR